MCHWHAFSLWPSVRYVEQTPLGKGGSSWMEIHVMVSTVWQDSRVLDSEVTVHTCEDLGTDQWWELDLNCLLKFCSFQADAVLCWRCFTIWLSQQGACIAWSNQKKCWRKRCVLSWHLRQEQGVALPCWSCVFAYTAEAAAGGRFQISVPQKYNSSFYFQVREESGTGTRGESSTLVCASFLLPSPFFSSSSVVSPLCSWILSHALKDFKPHYFWSTDVLI